MRPRSWLGALAIAACAACGQLVPDVGPLLAGACDNADSDPAVDVSFRGQIRPLLDRAEPPAEPGCSCHMPRAGGGGTALQISGLDLSSLGSLRAGGLHSGAQIVVDGEPCASILYQKVDEAPPFGSRMPLGGPPFLSTDEIRLIHDWIAEGANDN